MDGRTYSLSPERNDWAGFIYCEEYLKRIIKILEKDDYTVRELEDERGKYYEIISKILK